MQLVILRNRKPRMKLSVTLEKKMTPMMLRQGNNPCLRQEKAPRGAGLKGELEVREIIGLVHLQS